MRFIYKRIKNPSAHRIQLSRHDISHLHVGGAGGVADLFRSTSNMNLTKIKRLQMAVGSRVVAAARGGDPHTGPLPSIFGMLHEGA